MFAVLCISSLMVSVGAKDFYVENFDDASWEKRWVKSNWKDEMGDWTWTHGQWFVDEKVNKGIQTNSDFRHHAISSKLTKAFSNKDHDLVVQFTVKHENKEYAFCGGGYIKLLPSTVNQAKFGGDDQYHIMFGPDLCGYDVSKIHLIFHHDGQNLLKKEEIKLDHDEKNEFTHLYTFVLHPDQSVQVYFDGKEKYSGHLYEGWAIPAPTHDDSTDKKPTDWEDKEMINDPEDHKPAGWDDIPEYIADPDATKPGEWDEEEDGEWEAPQKKNPAFKGEWKAKQIKNPKYQGVWKPRQVPNPDFKKDQYIYSDIGAVGFEVWTVNNGTIFDNILITDSYEHAKSVAEKQFTPTKEGEKDAKEAWKKAHEKPAEAAHEEEKDDDDDDL